MNESIISSKKFQSIFALSQSVLRMSRTVANLDPLRVRYRVIHPSKPNSPLTDVRDNKPLHWSER